MNEILGKLESIVGAHRIVAGDSVGERPTSFWNHEPTQAKAIVMPATTDEVSAILACCHDFDQTVVIQGGLTNCVAAAESTADDVALSLEKMTRIDEIDVVGGTVVVEAGAILQDVQEAVAEQGFCFPLDLGARGSCTIGGNISTNAGGIKVLRYGMMRNLVLGLEAVLADGTVISSMNRMLKNNAGYDLKQLFIGTEGTLGVVTRAVLRLFPQLTGRQSAIVAMRDFDAVSAFLNYIKQHLAGSLSAFEIMWGDYFAAVTGPGGHRPPMSRDHAYYVILESEGGDPDAGAKRFEEVLAGALDERLIVDAVIPKSEAEARDIWEIRENIEDILEPGPVYLYDVSLPIREMDKYITEVKSNVASHWPDGDCFTLGHIADGNLHICVRPNEVGEFHDASDECVYGPLATIGGSISAEHGIGTEKLKLLSHSRSDAEIELMRALKNSLDPKNLLNTGRVFTSSAARVERSSPDARAIP